MNVAVIGASDKPDRYSYKAVKLLLERGHRVYPVHPRVKDIDCLAV
ncbi:MAG: CoA-binding protein, partial [Candidatus Omnitrophica bacterium]|nr:CoA-binding protein [Candidatus Omnitrophota bacterium]